MSQIIFNEELPQSELNRPFSLGFMSDGVVRILNHPYRDRTKREQAALANGYNFLEMIERGKKQSDTLELQPNAPRIAEAYRRSLQAYGQIGPDLDFNAYLANLKTGLDMINSFEHPKPEHIVNLRNFFKFIGKQTLQETQRQLYH